MKRIGKHITAATFAASAAFSVAFLPSCERVDSTGITESGPDSLITVVYLGEREDIRTADILIYNDEGLRRLEAHTRLQSPGDSAVFLLPCGDKTVVGIANCSDSLDINALKAYDTMEMLRFYYQEDKVARGLMSGTASCFAGDTVLLEFSPPMCSITLESIEHCFSGYRRLEDPIIFLSDVNPSVEVLRRDSFLPVETISDTVGLRGMMWDRLPCDVGMYPQHPGTRLFCYPNESAITPTRLTVEGTPTGGEKCRFTTALPPLSYGGRLSVSLEISDRPEDYKFTSIELDNPHRTDQAGRMNQVVRLHE